MSVVFSTLCRWLDSPEKKTHESRIHTHTHTKQVRHEAALAIGCLGTWNKKSYDLALKVLQKYAQDKDRLVSESCECALDDLTAPIDWVGKDGW